MAAAGRRDRAPRCSTCSTRSTTRAPPTQVARYQVEPYVVAADVYGAAPHVGRGGWTWYTGSSGWMLRVALESVLGVTTPGGDTLRIAPCIPDEWPGFAVRWRVPGTATLYDIDVTNPDRCSARVVAATVDGEPVAVADGACRIPLVRDGGTHRVEVVLGRQEA